MPNCQAFLDGCEMRRSGGTAGVCSLIADDPGFPRLEGNRFLFLGRSFFGWWNTFRGKLDWRSKSPRGRSKYVASGLLPHSRDWGQVVEAGMSHGRRGARLENAGRRTLRFENLVSFELGLFPHDGRLLGQLWP